MKRTGSLEISQNELLSYHISFPYPLLCAVLNQLLEKHYPGKHSPTATYLESSLLVSYDETVSDHDVIQMITVILPELAQKIQSTPSGDTPHANPTH